MVLLEILVVNLPSSLEFDSVTLVWVEVESELVVDYFQCLAKEKVGSQEELEQMLKVEYFLFFWKTFQDTKTS